MTEATGLIKIVRMPRGEAPEEIRQAWVGLTLPAFPTFGYAPSAGALSGMLQDARDVFEVPQAEALAVLKEHHPEAAAFWTGAGFPQPGGIFHFGTDEADILNHSIRRAKMAATFDRLDHPGRECDFCDGHVPYRK